MIKIKNTFRLQYEADAYEKKLRGTPGILGVYQDQVLGYNGYGNFIYYQVFGFDNAEFQSLYRWKELFPHAEEVEPSDREYTRAFGKAKAVTVLDHQPEEELALASQK